jgi:hypothetical protein
MGCIFNNYDDEDLATWDCEGYIELDDPFVIVAGDKHLEIHFMNTSHAKIGVDTLTMKEKSYQGYEWREVSHLLPNIIGQTIIDIKLATFSKGFYDSVFMGDGSRPDGGDYFDDIILFLDNGHLLTISGSHEYMHIVVRHKDDLREDAQF